MKRESGLVDKWRAGLKVSYVAGRKGAVGYTSPLEKRGKFLQVPHRIRDDGSGREQ